MKLFTETCKDNHRRSKTLEAILSQSQTGKNTHSPTLTVTVVTVSDTLEPDALLHDAFNTYNTNNQYCQQCQ